MQWTFDRHLHWRWRQEIPSKCWYLASRLQMSQVRRL